MRRKFIPVFLGDGTEINMVVRSDTCGEQAVVFADAKKLLPHMNAINARYPAQEIKENAAREGLRRAQADPAPGPDIHPGNYSPLPLALVHCDARYGFSVSDGITRVTELLRRGAGVIPLEVSVQEAPYLQEMMGGALPLQLTSDYRLPFAERIENEPNGRGRG